MTMHHWPQNERSTASLARHLVFPIDADEYAIDFSKVWEIRVCEPLINILPATEFCCGLLHLRGEIVPVVDLREVLRLPTGQAGGPAFIIIVAEAGIMAGVMVDQLAEVLAFDARAAAPVALPNAGERGHFLRGVSTPQGRCLRLVSVAKLVDAVHAGLRNCTLQAASVNAACVANRG